MNGGSPSGRGDALSQKSSRDTKAVVSSFQGGLWWGLGGSKAHVCCRIVHMHAQAHAGQSALKLATAQEKFPPAAGMQPSWGDARHKPAPAHPPTHKPTRSRPSPTAYTTPCTASVWPASQAPCTMGLVHMLKTCRMTFSSTSLSTCRFSGVRGCWARGCAGSRNGSGWVGRGSAGALRQSQHTAQQPGWAAPWGFHRPFPTKNKPSTRPHPPAPCP